MLVYLIFSFLNFAVLEDGSILSQSFIHLQFLFDHSEQIIALFKNISPQKYPFVQDIGQDIASIDTTTKDSYILFLKKEESQQALVKNPALYVGQPVNHVHAINGAKNLEQIASALNAIRLDPNMFYQTKVIMLSHSKVAYTEHFEYLLKTASFNKDLPKIIEAQKGLSFCYNVLPQYIATIPNKPIMPKL